MPHPLVFCKVTTVENHRFCVNILQLEVNDSFVGLSPGVRRTISYRFVDRPDDLSSDMRFLGDVLCLMPPPLSIDRFSMDLQFVGLHALLTNRSYPLGLR